MARNFAVFLVGTLGISALLVFVVIPFLGGPTFGLASPIATAVGVLMIRIIGTERYKRLWNKQEPDTNEGAPHV